MNIVIKEMDDFVVRFIIVLFIFTLYITNSFAGEKSMKLEGLFYLDNTPVVIETEAVHMATRNPANLMGLTNRGLIKPGLRADIVMLPLKDQEICIGKTYLAGKLVNDSSED